MPITVSFLNTCRAAVNASAELAAFRAAQAAYGAAARPDKARLYQACYGDAQAGLSPAYRLRAAVREAVRASADATVSPLEQEEAYRTLVGEYAPHVRRPQTALEDQADLEAALLEDALS